MCISTLCLYCIYTISNVVIQIVVVDSKSNAHQSKSGLENLGFKKKVFRFLGLSVLGVLFFLGF